MASNEQSAVYQYFWGNGNSGNAGTYYYPNWGQGVAHVPQETPEQVKARMEAEAVARAREREAFYREIRLKRMERIRAQEEELKENGMVLNNFTVGCDPEFVILNKAGQKVPLSHYLVGNGEIGWDHSGRVAEIRPEPSKGIFVLLKRIQSLIRDKRWEVMPNVAKHQAGAMVQKESLGGHVWLGIDPFLDKGRKRGISFDEEGEMYYDRRPRRNPKFPLIIRALDAVTKRLEDLDILPGTQCIERRRGEYGKWGDIRDDKEGRFEYRTMASWLYHPATAYLCLTAAKLAACEPEAVVEALKAVTYQPWTRFKDMIGRFVSKDADAARVQRVLDRGLKANQHDPEADFREKWNELGL